MTQGIYQFPQENVRFNAVENKLPPCNVEAEEAILGAILLDPNAIYRVKDRLKPEHFYISAHKDIYQACLRLCNKEQPTDLLTVTNWLVDHDILTRIGGRNKLATVLDRTVSAVNIDALAALIIEKAVRRDLIKAGNEIIRLGYDSLDLELPEIGTLALDKVRSVVEIPIAPTKDEYQRWKHDRLLKELTAIYTAVPEPSLRFLKLKDLANDNHVTMSFLELFYLKSLTAQCSKLLSYDELKELAGATVREWLLNGLVPKSTTILLASDGGVGKTKFIYGLGKQIIQGQQFGQFHATGEKRRILYYQGDESPGDMVQALESLGYSEGDINKYVKVRFGWSAENMPALIQDLKEFRPDFVVIDSLSTANRFSTYNESQMEYARPILEMTGLANEYGCTFVIIHHTNREGGVRGTTAIRNAVSEVWQLTKDNTPHATPNDRLLEINKSRSRSSGKKYRMIFSPDDLTFTFLGEEETSETTGLADKTAKDMMLDFLSKNRNVKYTSEELAHIVECSSGRARSCLIQLSADGLISVKRQPGKPNLYFLAMEGEECFSDRVTLLGDRVQRLSTSPDHPPITSDYLRMTAETISINESQPTADFSINNQPITPDHPPITPPDHLQDECATSDTAKGDRHPYKKELEKKSEVIGVESDFTRSPDHLCPKPSPDKDSGGDRVGDRGSHPRSPQKIEEGKVYLSWSLGKQVKVVQIYPSVKKADVRVAGDAISKPRLSLTDLYPLPEDDWTPNTGKLAMYGGELVAIIGFRNNGREFQIEFQSGRLDYAKASKLSKPEL